MSRRIWLRELGLEPDLLPTFHLPFLKPERREKKAKSLLLIDETTEELSGGALITGQGFDSHDSATKL